jgi:AraC-like DNA-binding protein
VTPPDAELVWRFPPGSCPHYFIHFELPGIRKETLLPAMHPLGDRFAEGNRRVEDILATWQTRRTRAAIRLWDLLWEMSDAAPGDDRDAPSVLPGEIETARGIIDNEFSGNLNAGILAQRIGMSYSQLNRQFREHFGTTVGRYIAHKRLDTAQRLLAGSNLPIQVVAGISGIPDLQHFNKFIRKHCGLSPRQYRESRGYGGEP